VCLGLWFRQAGDKYSMLAIEVYHTNTEDERQRIECKHCFLVLFVAISYFSSVGTIRP